MVPALCVLSAAWLAPLLMFPLPVLIVGLGFLRHRRSPVHAGAVAVASVVMAGAIDTTSLIAVAPAVFVALWAAEACRKQAAWRVAGMVAVVSVASMAAWLAVVMMLEGMTVAGN